MENKVKDLLSQIIHDEKYNNDDKIGLTHILLDAITSGDLPLSDGLFLRVSNTEEHELMNIELFYDRRDEDGNISFGNTNSNIDQILDVMYKEYKKDQENEKKL